jgi:hypothetical protein
LISGPLIPTPPIPLPYIPLSSLRLAPPIHPTHPTMTSTKPKLSRFNGRHVTNCQYMDFIIWNFNSSYYRWPRQTYRTWVILKVMHSTGLATISHHIFQHCLRIIANHKWLRGTEII